MSLTVRTYENGELAIVHLVGRVEPVTFELVESALIHLLHEGKPKIVLDCSRLDYLNAAEIPLMLAFEARAQAKGGDIKWVGLSDQLATLVCLLNDQVKEKMFDHVTEAEKAFHSRAAVLAR